MGVKSPEGSVKIFGEAEAHGVSRRSWIVTVAPPRARQIPEAGEAAASRDAVASVNFHQMIGDERAPRIGRVSIRDVFLDIARHVRHAEDLH